MVGPRFAGETNAARNGLTSTDVDFMVRFNGKGKTVKKRVKKMWLEALRGKKYQQSTGCLQDNDGFCCLGVLTDLYLEEMALDWVWDEEKQVYHINQQYTYLPPEVCNWSGIFDKDPEVLIDGYSFSLSDLNDGSGTRIQFPEYTNLPFAIIADIIEKHFPEEGE